MTMKRAALILVLALAACDTDATDAPDGGEAPVQTTELTGVYQGRGQGDQRSRMCMISHALGIASFGLVTTRPDGGACSGAGEAVRRGEVLQLVMGGDEECVVEARITGTRVTFPADVAEGCAYYCSPGATLAGETFEKTDGTAEAAMRPLDLAGDPLCG